MLTHFLCRSRNKNEKYFNCSFLCVSNFFQDPVSAPVQQQQQQQQQQEPKIEKREEVKCDPELEKWCKENNFAKFVNGLAGLGVDFKSLKQLPESAITQMVYFTCFFSRGCSPILSCYDSEDYSFFFLFGVLYMCDKVGMIFTQQMLFIQAWKRLNVCEILEHIFLFFLVYMFGLFCYLGIVSPIVTRKI